MTVPRAGAVALAIVACLGCGEQQEATYADRRAALRAGAIERGWVPEWIPKTARDLREVHNVDTNQSMLSFRYDRGDRLSVPGSCSPATTVSAPPFRVASWPRDIPPGSGVSTRYAFFSCESGRAFLALLVGRDEAYYWRP